MGIFKTLRTVKTGIASMGAVQAQPVEGMLPVINDSTVSSTTDPDAQGSPIATDAGISRLVGLSQANATTLAAGLRRVNGPSVSKIINELSTNDRFSMPAAAGLFNTISPSYLEHLTPRNLREQSSDADISTRHFEPYEGLTGISHERPEVLMLTQFLPLFSAARTHSAHPFVDRMKRSGINTTMTEAGWYIDTQINARNLRVANIISSMRALKTKNFSLRSVFVGRRQELGTHLRSLSEITQFLLGLVRRSDALRRQLDLHDDIHETQPQQQVREHSLKFTRIRSNWLSNSLRDVATRFLSLKYNVSDTLVRLGYARRYVDENFSSTKLWLQMLLEYKAILRDHSLEFLDIEPNVQRNDDNAVALTRSDVKRFNVKLQDSPGLISVANLTDTTVDSTRAIVRNVSRAFSFIYEQGASFRSEEARIAALANVLCKEFNYSLGLATPWTVRALGDAFTFTPGDFGNVSLLDNVIGQFGGNVSEVPASQTNSLAGLAQRQHNNFAILPFESKYLEGDNGVLTPGSTWYVDAVFKTTGDVFQTQRLEELSAELKRARDNFSIIANGLNIFQASSADRSDRSQNAFVDVLGDPVRLIQLQLTTLVDDDGKTRPQVRDDRLTAVYSMAQSSDDIKAILFTYTLARLARAYNKTPFRFQGSAIQDNTPLTDALIDGLLEQLAATTTQSNTVSRQVSRPRASVGDANDLDAETIRTAMKNGTYMTGVIELFMSRVLSSFEANGAFNQERSRFSGHLDTIVLMVAFDMIVAMIARYGNQRVVGRQQEGRRLGASSGRFNYVVSRSEVNWKSATNDLVNRLEREQSLIHQITWQITNTLRSLYGQIDEYVNYLKSPPAIASLRALASVIDNPQEFQAMMSEQQIMMLGSTVHDILDRYNNRNTRSPYADDVDHDGDFDADDEFKILDDALVSPKLKNALYSLFGIDEFTGSRAYNKRILTVGIPLGFTRRLQQKMNASTMRRVSIQDRQRDIVNVAVYKIDMLNQDIVYKPKRFMFELSRFPVRNDQHLRPIPESATIDDLADAIPTRDFEESFEEGSNAIAYWRSGGDGDNNTRLALDADSYSFLSQEEKAEIIKDHLTSYLLEVYIKMMTGLNVAEHTFDIDPGDIPNRLLEPSFVKLLTDHKVQQVSNFVSFNRPTRNLSSLSPKGVSRIGRPQTVPTGGTVFRTTCNRKLSYANSSLRHSLLSSPRLTNISGLAGKVSTAHQAKSAKASPGRRREQSGQASAASSNLARISARHVPKMVQGLQAISAIMMMQTSLANGLQVQKQLLRPKQFDRVFNVIIDPDEFEVDYDKTMESEHGKIAMEILLKRGDLIPASLTPIERRFRMRLPIRTSFRQFGRLLIDPNVNSFRYRDRDKNQGDLMFEKYFVTIETYDEGST